MAYAKTNYVGDGVEVNYSVGFPYVEKSHVTVYLDNVETTAFTWLNDTVITMDVAPADQVAIAIIRYTQRSVRLVDYTDTSIMNEEVLDKDSNQLFFVMQETLDVTETAIIEDESGDLDASNRKIINVADGVDDGDAFNIGQADNVLAPQIAAADASAAAALVSENNAAASEAAAAASEASAAALVESVDNIQDQVDACEASEIAAAISAAEAAESAESAAASMKGRGVISGLALSNNVTDTINDIDIDSGVAFSLIEETLMELSTPLTKQLDATWAAGTNAGGLASGVSLVTTGWYHVFILSDVNGINSDIGFDTDVGGINLLADAVIIAAGHDRVQRVGSIYRNASVIQQFWQRGDTFLWKHAPSGQSFTGPWPWPITVITPIDVSVEAMISMSMTYGSGASTIYAYIASVDSTGNREVGKVTAALPWMQTEVNAFTDTASKLFSGLNAGAVATTSVKTVGWRDPRGKW